MAARDSIRKKPKDTKGTLRRLLSYIGEYKWFLILILVLCFVSNILSLLGPSYAGNAINAATAGTGKRQFDKRESIKLSDTKRELDRAIKSFS